ncbi:hypothetical protein [Candidatus Uabimicrobium sp. HlEnr_7]|uniref:hypothetical protein n=1 Tax=Candidatus Uabimicrobium helgolandensis TaxID=3095367 RepID=UPI0035583A08
MKKSYLFVSILIALFSIHPLLANNGGWLNEWNKLKKTYEKEAGKDRPKEKFLSAFDKSSLTPSLKDLDKKHRRLEKLSDEELREEFDVFEKKFKKFTEKKSKYSNYIEDTLIKNLKDKKQKKACQNLIDKMDKLEYKIHKFIINFNKVKKEYFEITFDLITCDDKTFTLLEPDGVIKVKVTLVKGAMKTYKKTIESLTKNRLKKIRKNLEKKLIDIDLNLIEDTVTSIISGKLDKEGAKALNKAQKDCNRAIEEAENQVDRIVHQVWMEMHRAKIRYRKYRLNAAKSIGKQIVKLTISFGRLALSNGADVLAYLKVAKEIYELGKTIYTLTLTPEKVGDELMKQIIEYAEVDAKLKDTPLNPVLLKKQKTFEEKIPTQIQLFVNKTSGLYETAGKLGVKIDKLEEKKAKLEEFNKFLEGEKLTKINKSLEEVKKEHEKLIKRIEEATATIKVVQNAFSNTKESIVLKIQKNAEKAYSIAQKIKSVGKKLLEVAKDLDVVL